MAQEWRLVGQVHALDLVTGFPDFQNNFYHVVDMALRVDTSGNGEPHQVHFGGGAEHQRADFYRADSSLEIEFVSQSYGGKVVGIDVREEGARVYIDGVAPGRLNYGDSLRGDMVAQVGSRCDAVVQIVFVQDLLQAYGDGFQVAAGQASIGGIAFGQDQ